MFPSRALVLLGLAAVCVAQAAALRATAPAVILGPPTSALSSGSPAELAVDPAFAAAMTPDDVVRGFGSLLADDALGADPLAALVELAPRGAALKRRAGSLRSQRRAAREALLQDHRELVALLGPERAVLLAGRGGP